ncbi:MAG: F0F1 ATP synthase subunit gamma [Candidatus Bipolaricaulota bacterium]|nr:F0F1 ATP synthase subunit gamma [Candidatus Bipolaricaulota bacterium]
MPGTKEIRLKIRSVQNTRKITKAMEMVAASKMRKAQERMRAARPYAEKIRTVAAHISHANPEYRHPFLVERDTVRRVGIILITTDKGLCGGLNTNVLRLAHSMIREWQAQGEDYEVCCIGNKGLSFMQRLGARIVSQVTQLGDRPQMEKLIGAIKVILDGYTEDRFDRLMLFYSLQAAELLKREEISAQVVNVSTIKPLDPNVITYAKMTGCAVSVEEHSVIGGLGGALAEVLCEHAIPLVRVGIQDKFGQSGKPEQLLAHYGLTAEKIAEAARNLATLTPGPSPL